MRFWCHSRRGCHDVTRRRDNGRFIVLKSGENGVSSDDFRTPVECCLTASRPSEFVDITTLESYKSAGWSSGLSFLITLPSEYIPISQNHQLQPIEKMPSTSKNIDSAKSVSESQKPETKKTGGITNKTNVCSKCGRMTDSFFCFYVSWYHSFYFSGIWKLTMGIVQVIGRRLCGKMVWCWAVEYCSSEVEWMLTEQ